MQGPETSLESDALDSRVSGKSYGTAVILSGIFGFVGVQHFYLGRWLEGLLDLGLTICWIYSLVVGEILFAILFMLADFGHSFIVTIRLLTGSFADGQGRIVCYPGQKLGPHTRG